MAVVKGGVYGTTANYSSATISSITYSHTVASGNARLLMVSVAAQSRPKVAGNYLTPTATFNGISMTTLIDLNDANSGYYTSCHILYIYNPPIGTYSLTLNFPNTYSLGVYVAAVGSMDFSNAQLGVTYTSFSTNTGSITTSPFTNSYVIGALALPGGRTAPTLTAGTLIRNVRGDLDSSMGTAYNTSSTTTATLTWLYSGLYALARVDDYRGKTFQVIKWW